jgi:hypothetical protein
MGSTSTTNFATCGGSLITYLILTPISNLCGRQYRYYRYYRNQTDTILTLLQPKNSKRPPRYLKFLAFLQIFLRADLTIRVYQIQLLYSNWIPGNLPSGPADQTLLHTLASADASEKTYLVSSFYKVRLF